MSSCPVDLQKRARYLQSIACLVKDVAKHDELQQQAQELLRKAKAISIEALRLVVPWLASVQRF